MTSRGRRWAAYLLIVGTAIAAYANSFRGAFVLDDRDSVERNPTIVDLSHLGALLHGPGHGATAQGRPVLNLSFALNRALMGPGTAGYHAVNLAIHAAAALLLFGVVRRTVLLPRWSGRYDAQALPIALAAAALWAAHPLQTEAVTYIVQRAESLMGLCFLAIFYGFLRRWHIVAVTACAVGMATKEVTAVAPILLLLFDRCFVAGSFAAAWRTRRRLYLALAATWLLAAALLISTGGNRGGSVGWGVHVSAPAYWLTQIAAIWRYFRLLVWPTPLIFEYGPIHIAGIGAALGGVALAGLISATLAALRRNQVAGFIGAWFFLILAPTSLVPGPTQMIVEHRMYLPLAAGAVAAVAVVYRCLGARSFRLWPSVVAALIALTAARNRTYASAAALWTDTVNQRPLNPSAHYNLGYALADDPVRRADAIAHYRTAIGLRPGYWEAFASLGNALAEDPSTLPEAIAAYQRALALNPSYADGRNNLALAYNRLGMTRAGQPGQTAAAAEAYRAALQIDPAYADAHNNLANLYAGEGRREEAIAEFSAALSAQPDSVEIHYNCAAVLLDLGRRDEALQHLQTCLRLRPDFAPARDLLTALDQR